MNKVVIIQARMGSTRLFGKVLKKIKKRTILDYVIDRLRYCKEIDNIVLATTTSKKDDVIKDYAIQKKINLFRGNEPDVLDRYYNTAKKYKADVVIRITGDCPLIDPKIVDEVIKKHITSNADYTSNVIKRTYPKGLDVEVFNFHTLEKAHEEAIEKHHREHVTLYIMEHAEKYKLQNIRARGKLHRPDIRITLDTKEDFELIKKIILYFDDIEFTGEDIIDFLDKNKKLEVKYQMINFEDIICGFKQIGIKKGDTVMVHSSYKSLGGVEGGAETVIDAFLELVGHNGTILFPTFNFQSWTENHYFDINETSSEMGIIGELARKRKDAVRTIHPIYSFAVLGKGKKKFLGCDDVEAFDDNSVFGLFHKVDGMIVSIGLDFNNTFSFHHHVEFKTGCNYRRIKNFTGIYVDYRGVSSLKTYSMFVRSLNSQTYIVPGMNELLQKGVIKEVQVGKAKVHYASAINFFDNMAEIVKYHPEKLHYVIKPKVLGVKHV